MINILLSGCNGKMGQVLSRLSSEYADLKIAAGFDIADHGKNDYPVFSNLNACNVSTNIIIDFSNPNALDNILNFAVSKKIPIVVATTGLSETQKKQLNNAAEKIPVFFSANMSLGVNLLIDLVEKAATVLGQNFDIEIIEKHHNQKIDAPSGTALAIANSINTVLTEKQVFVYDRHAQRRQRGKNKIGIHTVRGGTIIGDHSVIFAGNDEIIEINHIALSKDILGTGALRAARFLYRKDPGLYSMSDLVSEA